MNTIDPELVEKMMKICVGEGLPDPALATSGAFPEGWVNQYLSLLKSLDDWQSQEFLPTKLVYCFYRVGYHIGVNYSEWGRATGKRNQKTEKQLVDIRLATELFITGSFFELE